MVKDLSGRWGAHDRPSTFRHRGRRSPYLAVGDQLVCLNLVTGSREWLRRVDPATCFGVYRDSRHEALISHGELQISRLSLAGDEIWSATGADIFSEGFRCLSDGIEVIDFNRTVYLFDYRNGALIARK